MDVTPLIRADLNIIQSYKDDVIKVLGRYYKTPIAVTGDQIFALEGVEKLNDPAQILFLKDHCEIILCAQHGVFQPALPAVQQKFRDAGMTIDIMDYGAAARTYNVLATEGRPVAVIFL